MTKDQQDYYNIPIKYRRMENLHIVFWIFKDIGWCMGFTLLGITMITVWISANSFWMCTEFFGVDHISIGYGFTVKHLAMIPFLIGMLILAYYYIWYKPRHKGIL
jgi:hypothetical protein